MRIRQFKMEEDYEDVVSWWEQHQWPAVPKTHLPSTGVLIEDQEQKVAAVWIYTTDAAVGWVEWLITNPKVSLRKRSTAVDVLLKFCAELAPKIGVTCLISSIKSKSLVRRYERVGFKATDLNMTNLVYNVGEA